MEITQEMREAAAKNLAGKPISWLDPSIPEKVRKGWCAFPGCGSVADRLRDELSAKEFFISGMCQHCQDSIFGGGTK